MKNDLSVIVITRNEEKDIQDCLQSVAGIAQEIVIVDSGSTDKTLELARAHTQKIFHRDFTGYAAQKQHALDRAQGPWILNIDADERVSPDLAAEIQALLSAEPKANGFEIPYRHFFLGRRLRFGGLGGENHLRLFRKNGASYGNNSVHEGIAVPAPVESCRSPIDHTSYRDIEEYLRKCNEYTSLIAEQKYLKGERFHFWHHLRLPVEFLSRYIFKLGFLDGGPGFIYALLSSYYMWLKYLKLNDLESRNNLK